MNKPMNERLKTLYFKMLDHVLLRRSVEMVPYLGKKLSGFRTHPFDRQYGTDTSGFVPTQAIVSEKMLQSQINPYSASQPSIIRHAIATRGATHEYAFIDLGCGKGRAMIVASEFPFHSISGIELSPFLAKIARRNIETIQRSFPMRPPLTTIEGNAITQPLPNGKLVFFFYHSFGEELLSQLIRMLEMAISNGNGPIFFIYYNPVHGNLLDASAAFTRWYADTLPYDESELSFGPDTEDSVVIWKSVNGAATTPHPQANAFIVKRSVWRAELLADSRCRASAERI
jgi:hypothetical protein